MNLIGIGTIIETVGRIADDLITTDKERLELALKEQEIEAEILEKVHETNIEEAKHPSIFVAGWRPSIGWIGAISLGYQFVLYPLLTWLWKILQAKNIIPLNMDPPPTMESDILWTIIVGMLGIAGLRTYDKLRAVDTKRISR
ncbi:MAG: 3TM-type holin [Thermodesulforhabdaceae bacterium]